MEGPWKDHKTSWRQRAERVEQRQTDKLGRSIDVRQICILLGRLPGLLNKPKANLLCIKVGHLTRIVVIYVCYVLIYPPREVFTVGLVVSQSEGCSGQDRLISNHESIQLQVHRQINKAKGIKKNECGWWIKDWRQKYSPTLGDHIQNTVSHINETQRKEQQHYSTLTCLAS